MTYLCSGERQLSAFWFAKTSDDDGSLAGDQGVGLTAALQPLMADAAQRPRARLWSPSAALTRTSPTHVLPMSQQPCIQVAVVMERIAAPNEWEAWQFRAVEVVPDEGVFGPTPRKLHDDGKTSRWLHPGFRVELFADECKGYFLNLTSGRPVWFVSWREDDDDPSRVEITAVSLSYIEADRRLTAEERVENLPLEPELCEWLRLFTNEHFRPDTGRKVRAQSFLKPEERARQIDEAAPPTPAPTPELEPDLAALTSPEVDAQVRNAALRKLFHTDPHFRAPDGLDVNADGAAASEHSPLERQRQILRARALGLLDDELTDQVQPASKPSDA